MLFGEYDWMVVYEVPSGKEAAATMLATTGVGAVTDARTMLAMTAAEGKGGVRGRPGARRRLPRPGRDLTTFPQTWGMPRMVEAA
jgi:GYD domain-containing protein